MRSSCGGCRVIMRNGVLLPGMVMPALPPPPPDPHPNAIIQQMREEWNMHIIAWEAVWDQRPRWQFRRETGHWRDPGAAPRRTAEPA